MVLYKKVEKTRDRTLREVVNTMFEGPIAGAKMTTIPLKHAMLFKLLEINSKCVPPEYKPERSQKEESFGLSFIIPLVS